MDNNESSIYWRSFDAVQPMLPDSAETQAEPIETPATPFAGSTSRTRDVGTFREEVEDLFGIPAESVVLSMPPHVRVRGYASFLKRKADSEGWKRGRQGFRGWYSFKAHYFEQLATILSQEADILRSKSARDAIPEFKTVGEHLVEAVNSEGRFIFLQSYVDHIELESLVGEVQDPYAGWATYCGPPTIRDLICVHGPFEAPPAFRHLTVLAEQARAAHSRYLGGDPRHVLFWNRFVAFFKAANVIAQETFVPPGECTEAKRWNIKDRGSVTVIQDPYWFIRICGPFS